MDNEKILESVFQLFNRITGGDHIDTNTLLILCDELEFADDLIMHILDLDEEDLKWMRDENNA